MLTIVSNKLIKIALTEYRKLYISIWEERCQSDLAGTDYCECAECGARIYKEELTVHNFRHIKSKGAYPELKYDKKNIDIVCFKHHAKDHISGELHNYLPIK